MKRIILLTLLFISGQQAYSQGCLDFVDIHIDKVEEINTFKSNFNLQIPGKDIIEKGDYFVARWKALKMEKISPTISYVRNKRGAIANSSIRYTQEIDGRIIEGSYFVLAFDNTGLLKYHSHYGISDTKEITDFDKSVEINNELVSSESNAGTALMLVNGELRYVPKMIKNEDAKLEKAIGPPAAAVLANGSIYISNCSHSYSYNCDPAQVIGSNNLVEIAVGNNFPNTRLSFATQAGGTSVLYDKDFNIDVNSPIDFSQSGTDYLICPESPSATTTPGKFEYAMCFHHITEFSDFFDSNFSSLPNFGSLNFDPYFTQTSLIYNVESNVVKFGASNDDALSGIHDAAEDQTVIAAGAFHYWWQNNYSGTASDIPTDATAVGSGQGVFYGTLDYMVHTFIPCSTELYTWGSLTGARSVDLPSSSNYNNFVTMGKTPMENGQLWGTTLVELKDALGSTKVNNILAACILDMGSASTQMEVAALFMTKAEVLGCTDSELCTIAGILKSRYPSLEIDTKVHDMYIKDSQINQGANQEDYGIEPSVTTQMWVSPSIWNRRNADQGTTHQQPQHILDQPNYLYVELRDIACELPSEGRLRMYFSEASTGHTWPQDWDNAVPTNANLGYRVGNVLLTSYVDSYIDEDMEQVYLYEIKWFPLDPTDFDGYGVNDNMHGCVVGRIDSGQDPMTDEQENVHVSYNSKANNNVAMRNMSLMHVESGPVQPPLPPKHVLMIKHGLTKDLINPNEIVNDEILIELEEGGPIPAEDVHLYGDLEIELSEELMKAWIDGGMQGENVQFQAPNKIICVRPTTKLTNVKLLPTQKYPIRVAFIPKREFKDDINFSITLVNEAGCEVGGEGYMIYTDEERLKSRSDINFDERISSDNLTISPNPVSDIITISTNSTSSTIKRFEIYNVSGQKMFTNVISNSDKYIESDLSSLEEGLYYVKVELDNGDIINKKIVKL